MSHDISDHFISNPSIQDSGQSESPSPTGNGFTILLENFDDESPVIDWRHLMSLSNALHLRITDCIWEPEEEFHEEVSIKWTAIQLVEGTEANMAKAATLALGELSYKEPTMPWERSDGVKTGPASDGTYLSAAYTSNDLTVTGTPPEFTEFSLHLINATAELRGQVFAAISDL